MPPRLNSKAVAGRERKKEQDDQKKAEEARRQQEAEEKSWLEGANIKGQSRAESTATKADEAARKKREKEELWNAEQQQAGAGTKVKSGAAKKGGKKKKDDLSLLQDALVKGADQKLKERRAAEEAKRRRSAEEEQRKLDKKNNPPMMDPLLQNTEDMLQVPAGTSINRASMEEGIAASGLDGALESLGIGGGNYANSSKMTFKEFEERMLPIVKEDYPGLRLTQYKEKVFNMWKKSPENPSNQVP